MCIEIISRLITQLKYVWYNVAMKQIQLSTKKVTLIETAHVSYQSVLEVEKSFSEQSFDHVCIELDENRAQRINQPIDYSSMKLIDVIKEKKVILVVVNYILGQFQKRVASSMNSKSGDEMRMGIKMANEQNLPISYIDRDIQITFKRIWSYLTWTEKLKLILAILNKDEVDLDETDIENLKKEDVLNEALKEISQTLPTVHRILVVERDQYMAQSIKNATGNNIVAIVGAAHGPGIEKYLLAEDINLDSLKVIKQPSLWSKILKWSIPFLIMALILVGFGFNQRGLSQIGNWILWISLASALGALLCFSHPVTILVSFIFAVVGAIHPLLSVGWFAGISEAYFRAPTVKDFETLNEDSHKIKTALQNNILRTLLVMVVTSVFSALVTLYFSADSVRNFIQNLF